MVGKRVRTTLGEGVVVREFTQTDAVTYWGMTKGAVKLWYAVELDGCDYEVNFRPHEVTEVVTFTGTTRKLSDLLF